MGRHIKAYRLEMECEVPMHVKADVQILQQSAYASIYLISMWAFCSDDFNGRFIVQIIC